MKKISVIIPCYNVAAYIDRCMASVAAQTIGIEHLEIICIDDASTDNTWAHLQNWEKMFPENIILIRQKVNQRQGTARNIGIQYASADWISFVDADDWLEPDCLEQLYTPAVQYSCDVVFCKRGTDTSEVLTYFDENDRAEEHNLYYVANTEEATKKWLIKNLLGNEVWGKIIHKHLIMDFHLFFPEKLVYEDIYWIPLLHIYAKSAFYVGKKLYHYFLGSNDSTVRAKNRDYHIDFLTVQLMKWADYRERGLWEKYPDELKTNALCCAACFVQQLVLRYDRPSFSLFQLESELIRQQVPEYKDNPYLIYYGEIVSFLVEALYRPMNITEFQDFIMETRKIFSQ